MYLSRFVLIKSSEFFPFPQVEVSRDSSFGAVCGTWSETRVRNKGFLRVGKHREGPSHEENPISFKSYFALR